MPYYKVYRMNAFGGIASVEELFCENDEAAKARLAEITHDQGIELWQLGRKVAEKLPGSG
jgi:hypothetical protein